MAGNKTRKLQAVRQQLTSVRQNADAPKVPTLRERLQSDRLLVIPPEPRVNWYLMMLLDPTKWEEALSHGVRGVPDFYSHRNHIFVTRTVHDLDTSNFDSSGKCTVINRPSLKNHLQYTDVFGSSGSYAIGTYRNTGGFLYYVDEDGPNLAISEFSHYFGPADTMFFGTSGVLKCRDTGSGTGCKSIMGVNPSAGPLLFQYPITPGVANIVNYFIQFSKPVAVAGNITLSVVGSTGASTLVVAVALGDTSVFGAVTMNAADTYISQFTINNGTAGAIWIDSGVIYSGLLAPTSYTSLLSEPVQNYDMAVENLTAVRPVAGYCWVKYRGKLTSNGSIAGALIDSATNPTLSKVSEYDTIAGLLHSYEGSLTNGNYSIWCPMNPADTNYTSVQDTRDESPYIAVGIDADDVDAQQVRLECFWVWEGLTQNQMLAPKPGSVDIEMMNDAFAKLAHFDKSMENDLHLRKIAEFLRGGIKKGSRLVTSYLKDPAHRASLIGAAEQLANLSATFSPTVAAAARFALAAARTAG